MPLYGILHEDEYETLDEHIFTNRAAALRHARAEYGTDEWALKYWRVVEITPLDKPPARRRTYTTHIRLDNGVQAAHYTTLRSRVASTEVEPYEEERAVFGVDYLYLMEDGRSFTPMHLIAHGTPAPSVNITSTARTRAKSIKAADELAARVIADWPAFPRHSRYEDPAVRDFAARISTMAATAAVFSMDFAVTIPPKESP